MTKTSAVSSFALAILLSFFVGAWARAQDPQAGSNESEPQAVDKESPDEIADPKDPSADSKESARRRAGLGSLDDPDDPAVLLEDIRERGEIRNSVFPSSLVQDFRDGTDKFKQELYEDTNLKLGFAFTTLFQWLSESPLAKDTWGTTSDFDMVGTWELIDRGKPTQGQIFFGVEGRWDYGTTGPEVLGATSLGSLTFTANAFSAYQPAVILRTLYWQQGGEEAGWMYRIGKITPDATFGTSAHLNVNQTFITTAGVGAFSNAFADSGLGAMFAWYPNDRVAVLALVSDANADRTDFGSLGEGDLYSAIELGVKLFPKTEKAGYSKVTIWHTDGTDEGEPANGQLGPEGWGFFLKHEQELTDDGRAVAVMKYGKSFDESAVFEQLAGLSFLFYNPTKSGLQNDLFGAGFNWVNPNIPDTRSEYNLEVFYRLPLFPLADVTFSYQSVFNPSLDLDNDHASAFSIRYRMTF